MIVQGPLYHVTYYRNLPSIAKRGLAKGRGEAMGARASTHSKGAVFLSSHDDLWSWFELALDKAYDGLVVVDEGELDDRPGWTPVVLGIARTTFPECVQDEVAVDDGLEESYRCNTKFQAKDLRVYNGSAWVPMTDIAFDPLPAWDPGRFEFHEDWPLLPRSELTLPNPALKRSLMR